MLGAEEVGAVLGEHQQMVGVVHGGLQRSVRMGM
jgi:hypothetical protein